MLIENALNNFPLLFIMQQITCQQTIFYSREWRIVTFPKQIGWRSLLDIAICWDE